MTLIPGLLEGYPICEDDQPRDADLKSTVSLLYAVQNIHYRERSIVGEFLSRLRLHKVDGWDCPLSVLGLEFFVVSVYLKQ